MVHYCKHTLNFVMRKLNRIFRYGTRELVSLVLHLCVPLSNCYNGLTPLIWSRTFDAFECWPILLVFRANYKVKKYI